MKIQVDMKAFRAALAAAGKVIPAKSPIPIAMCIKIATNDNRITLTGTNFDMTFEMELAADVLTEGVTCIGFAALNAFCAATKGDSVTIEADRKSATVKSGKSRIVISALEPDDFPNYRPADGDLVTVDASSFVRAVKFCAAAAADDEVKYYLNGPAILEQDGRVQIWGTDGHALHHAYMTGIPAIGGGGILPASASAFICSAAEKADIMHFMISDRGWHVVVGPIRSWGKVIDGAFPDARRIVDGFKGWQEFLVAPKDEIAQALTVAACGADAAGGGSKSLALTGKTDGPVVLRGARGAAGILHAGRAETTAKASADVAFMLSSLLFQNALTAMASPEVSLSFTDRDGTSALQIKPAQADATTAMTALIMGMRASAEDMADAA